MSKDCKVHQNRLRFCLIDFLLGHQDDSAWSDNSSGGGGVGGGNLLPAKLAPWQYF